MAITSTGILMFLLPCLAAALYFVRTLSLTATQSASTLFRFFRSRHLGDLRAIFHVSVVVATVCISVIVAELHQLLSQADASDQGIAEVCRSFAIPLLAFCCVVIGWAYRSASTRLGVVDLFACEISTVCRVGTVFDVGERYIELYESDGGARDGTATRSTGPARETGAFVSEENYFPVFDSNSRDLQVLEARVVNDIVEFYTYMKALRDTLRRVATFEGADPETRVAAVPAGQDGRRRQSIQNAIFLTYLAYESGRKAVGQLVEFEPTEAEHTMVILLTELRCYGFLLKSFEPQDLRRERLELRRADYRTEVPKLQDELKQHDERDRDWLPALRTASELTRRYEDALSVPASGQVSCAARYVTGRPSDPLPAVVS